MVQWGMTTCEYGIIDSSCSMSFAPEVLQDSVCGQFEALNWRLPSNIVTGFGNQPSINAICDCFQTISHVSIRIEKMRLNLANYLQFSMILGRKFYLFKVFFFFH